jgi:hypothetical protein
MQLVGACRREQGSENRHEMLAGEERGRFNMRKQKLGLEREGKSLLKEGRRKHGFGGNGGDSGDRKYGDEGKALVK